jgi:hypothetical protein
VAITNFSVGQSLWYVPERRPGYSVTVTRIGSKWAYLSNGERASKSGRVDGGVYSSPGDVYESEAVYNQELARQEAWKRLYGQLSYSPPPKASLWQIEELSDLWFGN